jgi:hypothetical protein
MNDNEERRGEEARQLLSHPLLHEAVTMIEGRLIEQLSLAENTRERAEHLRYLLIAHRKYWGYLQQVVTSGTMAAMEEERKRTLSERVRSAWRAA